MPLNPIPRMGLSALPFVRAGLLLLGLLLPLHLPYVFGYVDTQKLLGWWSQPASATGAPGGAVQIITRRTFHAGSAGLATGDLVIRINGKPATSENVQLARDSANVGDTVTLVVRRRGIDQEIRVPVIASSATYVGYRWYRAILGLAGWLLGMALLAWRGDRRDGLILGAAILLVAPVTFSVEIPSGSLFMVVANRSWQTAAGAYRLFLPALLFHFLTLHVPVARIYRSGSFWVGVYVALALVAIASMDLLRDPLAWTKPGFQRDLRMGTALLMEGFALTGLLLARRSVLTLPTPLRWLSIAIFFFLVSGFAVSVVSLLRPDLNALVELSRQSKSLMLALVMVMSVLFFFMSPSHTGGEWHHRQRLALSASALLTGLYAFAVAGAAAIVMGGLGLSFGGAELFLFVGILAAALIFSPVLRWATEMVDRRVFARWSEIEGQVRSFVDDVSAALQPERIARRVAAELPAILGVASARLVLATESAQRLGAVPGGEVALASTAELAREIAESGGNRPTIAVPINCSAGVLAGVLRVTPASAHGLEPPETVLLRSVAQGIGAALRNAQAYQELRAVEQSLAESERLATIGALASGLAHEIKNPLAGLKMGLYLLSQDAVDPNKLRRLQRDLARIDDLVTGLLQYNHDGVMERAEEVDLRDVTLDCLEGIRPFAEDHSVELSIAAIPQEPVCVRGGARQLRLVVSNLVTNGIKAAAEGGRVTVALEALPANAHLLVRDTGPGIPPSLRGRIFEIGFSTAPGGSGLGLALARREVERMGGTIEIRSPPEGGTELRVSLPRLIDGPILTGAGAHRDSWRHRTHRAE